MLTFREFYQICEGKKPDTPPHAVPGTYKRDDEGTISYTLQSYDGPLGKPKKKEIDKENNQKSPVNNAKEKFEVLFFDEVKNGRTSIFTEEHLSSFIYKEVEYTEPSYSIIHPPA